MIPNFMFKKFISLINNLIFLVCDGSSNKQHTTIWKNINMKRQQLSKHLD